MEQFRKGTVGFMQAYVLELMEIEIKARSLIARAIEVEKCLNSVEIR